jgi:hypothetical protein
MEVSPIQQGFNAGEFSPFMRGQVDFAKRSLALETCSNLIPLKQGPLVRRGGTRFVKEVKDSSKRTAFINFKFDVSTAYQIEVGDQYMRFYRNNDVITLTAQNITGITKANPAVVTYSGSDTYANGDEIFISDVVGMTQVNNKYYKVANVNTGANTFELTTVDGTNVNSTSYTTYSSGGTIEEVYQLSTPYTQANLFDSNGTLQLHFIQSANVVYLFSPLYAPRALVRTSDTSWVLNTLILEDGPYLDQNLTSTTLALSGTSGSVTVTASATTGINNNTGFQTTDVGRIIRWKESGGNWTWLTITAWTSTTVVTATISGASPGGTAGVTAWRLGAFSDTTGWPRTGVFFQNRLCMGGCTSFPDIVTMSKTGGYSDTFILGAPTNASGTVADDNGITLTLPSTEVNRIEWMSSNDTGLVVGTSGQEWAIKTSAQNEIVTPSNKKADPISSTRSAYIQPVLADSGFIFVQAARRRVFDMIYSFDIDKLKPRDLTVLANHITESGIIALAYQQEPINTVWGVTTDGLLIALTYYPDQDVYGWSRHPIGGSFSTGSAVVESISVIPSSDGSRDELWMIVKRTINGSTRRYVEYMTRFYEDDIALEDAFHVDCGLTYDSTATGTVTGLHHLEGQTLKVLADGKNLPDVTVSSGSITLAGGRTASVINLGLLASWSLKTMEFSSESQQGTSQAKIKRCVRIYLKLLNSLDFNYGDDPENPDIDDTEEVDNSDYGLPVSYDSPPSLISGNTLPLPFPGGYNQSGYVYLSGSGVYPFCLLALIGGWELESK